MIKTRNCLEEDRDLIYRFYNELYISEFPDVNLREPLSNIIDSLHRQNDGRNAYHLIIGEDKGQIVGGAIVSYLFRTV